MATNTELLAQVVQTNTDLTNTIEEEVGKWQGERAESKAFMQEAVKTVVDNRITLYVDAEAGDDSNNGLSIASSLKTLDKALELTAPARDKYITINLKGGHTYQITKRLGVSAKRLVFATLHNPAFDIANDSYEEIQGKLAIIENVAYFDDNDAYNGYTAYTSGMRPSPTSSQTFYFHKVILKTPDIVPSWSNNIWTGLIHRTDFSGQVNVSAVFCYLDLGSPLVKSASGVGYLNTDMYANRYNLTRLIASPGVDNYLFSTSGKPIKCNFGGVYNRDTEGLTKPIESYLVSAGYVSSDPDALPRNVISNLDFRRSRTLRS
ncbi:hypothetical protein [Pseudoalteromonas sp. S16_S37]|uniref:hypothetical protein n=1 Tax=Pseudoalteromonas sp. S16_S37 TaxID=2720228 RepID=UPI0016816B4B|nr:hypothetical protein [Pseudoalteromonas sp. S16_S37]MBD1582502.1 hypothetical protein [Pseudoalteromonas sp. S16_S37]